MVGAAAKAASNPEGALAEGGLEAGRAPGHEPRKQDPEVVPRAQRRTFTAAYKLKIIREAAACTERGQIGALLRREGLYGPQVSEWRRTMAQALEPVQRGPKAKPVDVNLAAEFKALRRENAALQRQLKRAELIIDIQKKVATLLGIPLAKHDLDEDE